MTDWTEKLSDYLDGDMSGNELAKLEAALQGDAGLRVFWRNFGRYGTLRTRFRGTLRKQTCGQA